MQQYDGQVIRLLPTGMRLATLYCCGCRVLELGELNRCLNGTGRAPSQWEDHSLTKRSVGPRTWSRGSCKGSLALYHRVFEAVTKTTKVARTKLMSTTNEGTLQPLSTSSRLFQKVLRYSASPCALLETEFESPLFNSEMSHCCTLPNKTNLAVSTLPGSFVLDPSCSLIVDFFPSYSMRLHRAITLRYPLDFPTS